VKILLTNDDGVNAKGISVLREIALQISDDVWTCAPETEQSATSRSVSLHNPVRLKKYEERIYSVSGTPTDSVVVALEGLMPDSRPDLILSGVNRGQNLAEDITFSARVSRRNELAVGNGAGAWAETHFRFARKGVGQKRCPQYQFPRPSA